MNAVIREPSPGVRRGKRTPGQDPIREGEIVRDTEPVPPSPEPNAANPSTPTTAIPAPAVFAS